MVRWRAAGVAAWLVVCGCGPQPKPAPSRVISQQSDLDREAEASLVATPRGRTVAAWIGYGGEVAIHAAVSGDFGQTWAPPHKVADPALRPGSRLAADPSLATDGATTWLAWLSATDAGPEAGGARIEVAAMAADAQQFSAPVAVADLGGAADRPWLVATGTGALLLGWHSEQEGASQAQLARSDDHGRHWSITAPVAGPARYVVPVAGARGGIAWLLWLAGTRTGPLRLAASRDDGRTFLPEAQVVVDPRPLHLPPVAAPTADGLLVVTAELADDTTVEQPATAWRIFDVDSAGKPTPQRYADPLGRSMHLAQIATGEPGWVLSYLAGRREGDPAGQLCWVSSSDRGKHWSAPQPVGEPLRFTTRRASEAWPGDYLGMALAGPAVLLAWGANASGRSHVAFAVEAGRAL